ncbi:MAG: SsrA-binding protein SmpB [Alphaproteobacteria bacterium]
MIKKKYNDVFIKNKKAYFNYTILEEYTAGICLLGSEVKSLREGKCSIEESYADFFTQKTINNKIENALYLVNSHIAEYNKSGYQKKHDPIRKRKLLLHKKDIAKLIGKIRQKGFSLVPLNLFFNDRGLAKVKLGLGKGKSEFDKRDTIKNRDWAREKSRLVKG